VDRPPSALAGLVVTRDFWAGRKVFVTGHTGFKGSWLLLMLRELGAEVSGYSLPPPTDPSMFDLLELQHDCRHVIGDVRDMAALEAALTEAQPEIVLHLAAQPLVRYSYDQPVETYAVNVMGTVHLLDACRRVPGVRSIVCVTTDKCYENVGWVWGYRENDRLGGADPYSNSKAACELAVEAYRRSFFSAPDGTTAGVATARAGNVIGGGDFALDRLVPDAMRGFSAGTPVPIRNPLAVRPWQHVLEPLYGYLLLAEKLHGDRRFATGWNFGPQTDESASVGTVTEALAAMWGEGASWRQDAADHPHEAATLKLDSTKARLELGWTPRFALDEALHETQIWYKGFQRRENMRDVTERQVRSYLSQAAA
jgi:CDP-glucose 4,6-dehydratase